MSSRLILQVYVKLDEPIEGLKRFKPVDDLYAISIQQAKKFANKWGADYLLVEDQDFLPEYAPMYQRFKMFDMNYDQILYLDCDAVILDSCPDVFELFKDHEFSAVRDYNWDRGGKYEEMRKNLVDIYQAQHNYRPFCSGIILANRSFLERNKNNWQQYLDTYKSEGQYDQGIFNKLIIDGGGSYNELDEEWGAWHSTGKYMDHLGGPFRKADFNKDKYVRKMCLTDFYISDDVKSLFDW